MAQKQKKRLEGIVVSDKMNKTVVVQVERTSRHPLYGKVLRRHKKYHAHDEHNECAEGDRVRILESRPLSKKKRWVVTDILERSEQ